MKRTKAELELELNKLETELEKLKKIVIWQTYFVNEITKDYDPIPQVPKKKKNIFCDCCGEEIPKGTMKSKLNFSFQIELACDACQKDFSLAIANAIHSIRTSNGNLFLTRVGDKIK